MALSDHSHTYGYKSISFFWVLLLQHLWIVVFNQNDLMKIIEIFSGRSTGQES